MSELAPEIKKLLEEQQKSWTGLQDTMKRHDEEIKKLGEATADTKQEINNRIVDHGKKVDETNDAVKKLNERQDTFETKVKEEILGAFKREKKKTPGEIFLESEQYKSAVKNGESTVKAVKVGSFSKLVTDAGGTPPFGSSGGPLVTHESLRIPGIIYEPEQELRIRDLLNVSRTSAGVVEYIREYVFSDDDSETSRGDTTGGAKTVAEMATKPESFFRFEQKTATPSVIATFVTASRQVLSDVSQLMSHINTRLMYSIKLAEEHQLLYGDGNNPNLEGITINAANYNRGAAGDTDIDTLRRAVTQVMLANYPNTGFVLHPAQWESIELHKDSQNRYLFANPQQLAGPRMWGYPVVPSQSMIRGDFLAGAFGLGAQLYDVWDANIRVAEQHNDLFLKNAVVILAEERLILANFRPAAFVYGQGDLST
jgi:HK97 family phage major capsid protein